MNTVVLKQTDGSNICYFEYDGNRKVKVHMFNGEIVRISTSITALEKEYEVYGFALPHQSFFVNMDRVKNCILEFDNRETINTVQNRKKEFQAVLALLHPVELKFINYVLLFLLLAEFSSVIIIPLITHETINQYLETGNLISSYLMNWFIMFVLFVFEIIMIGYTTKLLSDETTDTVLIVVLSGYFLINLLVAYLIFKTSKSSEVKYEYELLQQQSVAQLTLYRDLLEKYEGDNS